jgi:DNA-binding IclR family transcriptional regulator
MLHGTSGHVMLAFMSQQHREATLQVIRSSTDPKQALAREDARIRSIVNLVRAQGFAHIIYKEYPEASVGVPIFLNGVARACLLMGYVKAALKPAQIVDAYVPQLKSLSEAITAGVSEMRIRRRETQRAINKKRQEERDAG